MHTLLMAHGDKQHKIDQLLGKNDNKGHQRLTLPLNLSVFTKQSALL